MALSKISDLFVLLILINLQLIIKIEKMLKQFKKIWQIIPFPGFSITNSVGSKLKFSQLPV